MSTLIRPAEKKDCERMMELIHELALYERAPEEVTVSFDHFVESGFGPDPVWWAYVAELDGRVEAFALYYIRYSTWKGQRMNLKALLVTDKLKPKGIGILLFDALIRKAKEKKLNAIACQALK